MLHLDTNALIALPVWAREGHTLIERVLSGEQAAVSAVAWYEFLCGPVAQKEIELASAFIENRVIPVDADHAALAAELFNASGRRRVLRTDTLIAAVALHADADLVTLNRKDFEAINAPRLRLLPP